MKILRVNHLGIVPKDVTAARIFFSETLGLTNEGQEHVAEQKVAVDFIRIDDTRLELLAPTSSDSPIAKFLETRGSGIQHIALEVDNIDEWVAFLKQKGVQLIDETPKIGAHHTRIVFVHPRATGGVLVELVEESKKTQ